MWSSTRSQRAGVDPARGRGRHPRLRAAGARDRRQHRAPGGDPRRPAGHGRGHDGEPLLQFGPADDRARGAAHHRGRSFGHRRRRARKHQPGAGRQERCRSHDEWIAGAQARDLHADDRHRRHRRRALQGQPRGAGRLRAGKPAPHRDRAAGQALRRRDRAAADHEEGRRQGHQGGKLRAGDAHERRRQPPRHHARRARRAQAGARRQVHHRRQCEPALRRRLGLRGDGRQSSPSGADSSRSAPSAASPSPAASPTRWASARCSRCRSCSSAMD